jgi:hypothetical protein
MGTLRGGAPLCAVCEDDGKSRTQVMQYPSALFVVFVMFVVLGMELKQGPAVGTAGTAPSWELPAAPYLRVRAPNRAHRAHHEQ